MTVAVKTLLGRLLAELEPCGRLAVAFSGGVDSSVVLAAAVKSLGAENVLAVTADSETLPSSELEEAKALAASLGVPHAVIETRELDDEEFCANGSDRCYHCKTELWRRLRPVASEAGIDTLADGVNADDTGDFRPGIRASDEAGVIHPLAALKAGKAEVRALARTLELANWDKPAQACLSSRFPYGSRITAAGLKRVELAEEALRRMGFTELRVRDHDGVARIEVPEETLGKLIEGSRRQVIDACRQAGFDYVTIDLDGLRSGSMNEVLRRCAEQ